MAGKKSYGKDYNFFQKVTVTTTDFPDDSQCFINICKPITGFSLINEGSVVVEYSFNGNILHGDMIPGTASSSMVFDNRVVNAIFFRVPSGGSAVVRVEAWAT